MNYSPLSCAATTAVSLPLPVFFSLICLLIITLSEPLCLSLPVFLVVQLFPVPYCCCVTAEMLVSGEHMGGCCRRL